MQQMNVPDNEGNSSADERWTRQQLLAFRRGSLTDPDLEREMQEDYDTNPNSQIREFIERRRMQPMRILDPNDDCFMSILFEDDEDTIDERGN